MLISLGSPVVLLTVAFVGMVGSIGTALWLWLRLRLPGPGSSDPPGPLAVTKPAGSTPQHAPPKLAVGGAPSLTPAPVEDAPADRTEFIPSPLALARASQAAGPDAPPTERTVFLPPEFDAEPGPLPPSAEPTLPGFAPASGGAAAPELGERTMFVAPSFGGTE